MSTIGKKRLEARRRRHRRVRKKVSGTAERPRLVIFRSLKHIYAQLVDDASGRCLVTVSSLSPDVKSRKDSVEGKAGLSVLVGKTVAEKAQSLGIQTVAFDRGGYLYHGRVKALADGAREGGLKF
jgi:large subunit ribosomal protein L18